MVNTKRYGNIGEAMAISLFVKHGIPIAIPFGDNEKYDLIAEFNGKLNKIQVKTSISKAENGTVTFDVTSSSLHRKNVSKAKYTKNDIDYFFCYNIETNKSFLIEAPETPVNMITIRIDPPKNKQVKNIRYEKDYLFENVIKSFDIIGM